jgi:hypothetical protein
LKFLAERMNRFLNDALHNGSLLTDPNLFNGIKMWLDTNQIINVNADIPGSAGFTNGLNVWSSWSTANGQALVAALDYTVDLVGAENALILANDQFKRALEKSCRDANPAYYKTTADTYEREINTYKGIPIVNPGANRPVTTFKAIGNSKAIIPNNFSYGGASTATEAYVLRKGAGDGCVMIEYQPLDVRTVSNEMTQGPAALYRADWAPGFYRFKENAIAKLSGVIAV